jgi:hypothetical protein
MVQEVIVSGPEPCPTVESMNSPCDGCTTAKLEIPLLQMENPARWSDSPTRDRRHHRKLYRISAQLFGTPAGIFLKLTNILNSSQVISSGDERAVGQVP